MAPIHDAARDANIAELGRLLAEGASPDAMRTVRHPQETPLHVLFGDQHDGARDGSMDARVACFELLRDAGANLEARLGGMSLGITVLHLAAKGYPRVVSLLVEEGVNVNAANGSGYTPLHWAARGDFRSSTDCLEVLLKAGAAVNALGGPGLVGGPGTFETPFDVAVQGGHRRMWPLLLRAGAEIPHGPSIAGAGVYHPYITRVRNAGGYRKYAQNHLAAMTKLFAANGRRLPPEVVRQIMKFWLHLGYY